MFNVNDRVKVEVLNGLSGTVMESFILDETQFYLVDVDGYSNTPSAKALNAIAGLDHGYVPLLESDLELI